MTAQPDVTDLQVTVTCYNADGTIGAQARQGPGAGWLGDSAPAWRRRLQQVRGPGQQTEAHVTMLLFTA